MNEFFLEIWGEREHFSDISQRFLGDEPFTYNFHHVFPKESYPDIQFERWNIILVTLLEHENIHNSRFTEKYKEIIKKTEEKYEDWKEKNAEMD